VESGELAVVMITMEYMQGIFILQLLFKLVKANRPRAVHTFQTKDACA